MYYKVQKGPDLRLSLTVLLCLRTGRDSLRHLGANRNQSSEN